MIIVFYSVISMLFRINGRVLSGVKFFGGNPHIYLHVRMYIHTCVAWCGVAWRKHDVVYSMILKTTLMHAACISVFFQNNDEDEAMAKYSDVRNRGQICMWNDSGLN